MATERANGGGWRVTAGFVAILVLAGGWFLLSSTVMHTAVLDALGEAAGVAFALLVIVSVIGAVLSSRRGDPPGEPKAGDGAD
jgi:hypothetical protein